MSCLAHNKRFRSSFHSIINELYKEQRLPVDILRTMPRRCCTCQKSEDTVLEPSKLEEGDASMRKLGQLNEQVYGVAEVKDKLIQSLVRFNHLIHANRNPPLSTGVKSEAAPEETSPAMSIGEDSSSSSSSPEAPRKKKPQKRKHAKRSKPIKSGVFVYLPYLAKSTTQGNKPGYLMDVARKMQLSRFLGCNGHLAVLEKQYNARLNIITAKTSKEISAALENAKKGLEQLTIHKAEESLALSAKQNGEWVLVRPKQNPKSSRTSDIDQLLNELTNRWEKCLNIEKRSHSDSSEELDNPQLRKKYFWKSLAFLFVLFFFLRTFERNRPLDVIVLCTNKSRMHGHRNTLLRCIHYLLKMFGHCGGEKTSTAVSSDNSSEVHNRTRLDKIFLLRFCTASILLLLQRSRQWWT